MVDQMTLQTIGILLTAVTVSIAAIYYTLTLSYTRRNQELQMETRRIQAFMELTSELHSDESLIKLMELYQMDWEDFDDFERKYGSDRNLENFGKRYSKWYFYNRIGWLLHEEAIDIATVDAITAQFALWMWDKFESIIVKQREVFNLPDFLIWFEYLVKELQRYREERGISTEVHKGYGSYPAQNP